MPKRYSFIGSANYVMYSLSVFEKHLFEIQNKKNKDKDNTT